MRAPDPLVNALVTVSRTGRRRLRRPAATLSVVLAACSVALQASASELPSGAAGAPVVIETFEVGAEVYVRSLVADEHEGALWVATSLGAHKVDLATQELEGTFTRDNGLANEYVFAMLTDSRGGAWFGTNGGGVSHYQGGEWRTYFPMHGLADYWVYAFSEERPGIIWIGTWAGANRLDVETGQFETYYDELVNEWVYGVGVDSQQRIWFGTEGGISMYDGEQWAEWTHDDGLGAANDAALPPSTNTGLGTRNRHDLSIHTQGGETYNPNYVFCIHIAGDDTVWAGTWGGGASYFDGESWKNLTTDDGLAGNVVFAITEDADGNLWFGTDKGLSRFDGSEWQSYDRESGLLGEAVYALAAINGELWAGTRGGVARLANHE